MRLDATIEVCCDRDGCFESVSVKLPFVYASVTGAGGRYDHSDYTVTKLAAKEGWIRRFEHDFCCEDCAKEPTP